MPHGGKCGHLCESDGHTFETAMDNIDSLSGLKLVHLHIHQLVVGWVYFIASMTFALGTPTQ